MSDATTEVKDPATDATPAVDASMGTEDTASFTERYSEVLGKVNDTLDQVDWNQMGRIGKIVGIFAAVIVAQILIKGILDTINLLPIVPDCLSFSVLWWWASGAGRTSPPATSAPPSFNASRPCVRNTWGD